MKVIENEQDFFKLCPNCKQVLTYKYCDVWPGPKIDNGEKVHIVYCKYCKIPITLTEEEHKEILNKEVDRQISKFNNSVNNCFNEQNLNKKRMILID